ncbi:sulfatase-like hydrolase/transferase [Pseudomonas mangrovi]|uniref:Sulfatase n=1 Tax=Pseudomonas mangrovi TaxID=2161748 RepID=A0A2T5PEH1_9PSED|nr:sulfatase-like hydrolase/transferase [Pseudomonas mangrovi]PTU76136.1 sulfatase [Pseudomonas mangrovi]
MNRRDLIKLAGTLSAGSLAAPLLAGETPAVHPRTRGRPNILLIVTDQERSFRDLPDALTLPAHEALLARGVSLGNYHANTTPCSPSRSVMFTGQHTQKTQIVANHGLPPFNDLSPTLPTLGHMLREQGYTTAYKGKWHLSHMPGGDNLTYGVVETSETALQPYGFADYNLGGDPHGTHLTGFLYDRLTASDAARWMQAHRDDEAPWLLAVNFVNPHDIMFYSSGPAQERSRLRQNFLGPISAGPGIGVYDKHWDIPLPASFHADDLSSKPWVQRADVELCNAFYGHIDPADEAAWVGLQSYYFNCIRDVDESIGQVLGALRASGQDDNTIVVLTADHGEMAGAHRLRQKGPHMYRENTRVNFIVRHPDLSGGVQSDALGSSVDLVPTLLELAGVAPALQRERYPQLAGVSLCESLGGASGRSQRDELGHLFNYGVAMYIDPEFTQQVIRNQDLVTPWSILRESLKNLQLGPSREHRALFRGIHDGRYKFARYFAPKDHHLPNDFQTLCARNDLELYDTLEDPDEVNNLAADPLSHQALLTRLNARTNALIEREVGRDDGSEHIGPAFLYSQG